MAVLVGAAALTGCDSGAEETTVEQDAANIDAAVEGLADAATAFKDGALVTSVQAFLDTDGGGSEWAESVVTGLEDVLDIGAVGDDYAFDFDANLGVYAWDRATESWSRTGSADHIALQFPSSEGQPTNDALLTLRGYADAAVTVDGEAARLPTRLDLDLTVGGTRVFGVDLQGVQYDSGADVPVPTALTLTVFAAPHTHAVSYTRRTSTTADLTYRITDGSDAVANLALSVALGSDDYESLEEEDVEQVAGTLGIGSALAVTFDVQPGAIAALDDPTEDQINALVAATVTYDGQNIGTLEYDEPTEDVFIVYKDGTSESTDRFYDRLIDRLEDAFEGLRRSVVA